MGDVASYLDLVVRILRSSLVRRGSSRPKSAKYTTNSDSRHPAESEAFALALLRQRIRGRTLPLFCENLVDLFHGLGEEGQKRWRATIQGDGNWTIVASTPALFAAITLQDSPFYGFFTNRALGKNGFRCWAGTAGPKGCSESKTECRIPSRPCSRSGNTSSRSQQATIGPTWFCPKESLEGSLSDWERALNDLALALDDLPDYRIPLEMLRASVRYADTGDKRTLLSLPLEQRQLLKEILPPAAGERAGSS